MFTLLQRVDCVRSRAPPAGAGVGPQGHHVDPKQSIGDDRSTAQQAWTLALRSLIPPGAAKHFYPNCWNVYMNSMDVYNFLIKPLYFVV